MTIEAHRFQANLTVPLLKAEEVGELRVVTGIVLEPNEVDAHGDIVAPEVIRDAAYDFLARYNKATELGVQHELFGDLGLELVESFIAPVDYVLPGGDVKAGSWVISVRVLDDNLWIKVKDGSLTGFSIGATATVPATPENAADAEAA